MIVFDVEMTLKNGSNLLYLLVICIASKNIKFNDTAGARVVGLFSIDAVVDEVVFQTL